MSSFSVSTRGRWLAVCGLYVCLTLVYARQLLPVIGSALPNDIGDPGLNSWILWWNAHAVPLTARWWDGPIFYPAPGAMALSETFLNLWPLSTPMQWAGASAVLTHNVMFLLSFPTAALAAHALARRLAGRHDVALIAGLAFGFAPYRSAQISHLQTLWSCWMPLGLLVLHRFVDTRRRRDLALFALCWIMNGLATGYYLFFFSVLVAFWLLWFARTVRDWLAIGATIVVASLAVAPLLVGYRQYQASFGMQRGIDEIVIFSADLSAIWTTSAEVLPRYWTIKGGPEGELYPGATILGLVLVGGIVVRRRMDPSHRGRATLGLLAVAAALAVLAIHARMIGGWEFKIVGLNVSLTHPARTLFLSACLAAIAVCLNLRVAEAWRRRSTFFFYSIAAGLMLLFALGPRARLFGTTFLAQAPYYWLMHLPGGHAFRVPARFGMLFALCLAVAAALAFQRLTTRGARPALLAALCLAVAMEGVVFQMEVPAAPPPIALGGVERNAVLLELPIDGYFKHLNSDNSAMLRATRTGAILVNGFSGYTPPHYEFLKAGLRDLDASMLRALQRFGPLLVFVHEHEAYGDRSLELVAGLPDARRVLGNSQGTLFQLPARLPEPPGASQPLPVASTHAAIGGDLVAAMVDGDLNTRWQTGRHQASGDEVRITLDHPATVTRLELDLGLFKDDYPRGLRIQVGGDGAAPTIVWNGSTTGAAMLASLADRKRMMLALDLAPQTRGREIVLTVLDGHDDLAWSIAELRVFGR